MPTQSAAMCQWFQVRAITRVGAMSRFQRGLSVTSVPASSSRKPPTASTRLTVLSSGIGVGSDQRPVSLRPPVAEELPGIPHLADHVEVYGVHEQLVPVVARLRLDLAARVDDVARAVELAHLRRPGLFLADAVDRADEDAVGRGGGRLLEF